jgi:hypothetical protein
MTLPNFIVIGPPKTGTTSLNSYLKQHPQIFMCPIKEPGFFMLEGERLSTGQYRSAYSIAQLADYEKLFDGVENQMAIGEASTRYFYSQKAANRIKHYIPGARLITILRDPVERAYSEYLMLRLNRQQKLPDFEQAVDQELQGEAARATDPAGSYIQGSFYYDRLQTYLTHFPITQVRIIFYEDYLANPQKIMAEIFQFLGVAEHTHIDTSDVHNKSGIPRSENIGRMFSSPGLLKQILKPFIPKTVWKKARLQIRNYNLQRPAMNPETRSKLIDLYREDILLLQDFLDRDLSSWLDQRPPSSGLQIE